MAKAVGDELVVVLLEKTSILTDVCFENINQMFNRPENQKPLKTTVEQLYKNKNLIPLKFSSEKMETFQKSLRESNIAYQIRGEKNSQYCYLFLQGENTAEIKKALEKAIKKTHQKKPSTIKALQEIQKDIGKQDLEKSKSKAKNMHPNQER